MKILRIYFRLPPMPGGMEIHIAELSRIQAGTHDVTLAFCLGDNVPHTKSIRILKGLRWFQSRARPWTALIFYIFLMSHLWRNKKKFDVIHQHGDWSSFLFAPALQRITGASKVFFSFHGQVQNHYWHRVALPKTLAFCHTLFCTGFDAFSKLKPFCSAVFQPSGVRHCFLNTEWSEPDSSLLQCVTTSIFRKEKNLLLLLQIAQQLPQIQFTILGDGPDFQYIKAKADQMHLKNVTIPGFCNTQAIMQQYMQSNVYLHVSFQEGTPTTVMEAMAMGMPIIAAHAPGLEQICIPNENGILIQDGITISQQFVNAINDLLSQAELRHRFSLNNKRKSREFSWYNIAENIEEAFISSNNRIELVAAGHDIDGE
jgi:glycosyltransferase involved in cell wall biosynthesis